MTRGRRPLVALKEAYEIALKRGEVLLVSDGRYEHFHFIIFQKDRIVFVKVKRTLTNTDDPKAILDNYDRDVRHVARVPLNDVDARELWARSPRGDFFFFRVEKDRILRLLSDGAVVPGAEYPVAPEKPEPAQKPPEDPAANGSTCDRASDPAGHDPAGKEPAGETAPKKPAPKRKGKKSQSEKVSVHPAPAVEPVEGACPESPCSQGTPIPTEPVLQGPP